MVAYRINSRLRDVYFCDVIAHFRLQCSRLYIHYLYARACVTRLFVYDSMLLSKDSVILFTRFKITVYKEMLKTIACMLRLVNVLECSTCTDCVSCWHFDVDDVLLLFIAQKKSE